jgi:hypothetical protein
MLMKSPTASADIPSIAVPRRAGGHSLPRHFLLASAATLGLVKNRGSILSVAILAAAVVTNGAAASPAMCDARLHVELTPAVPNPRDSWFLSSLLSNQVNYPLTLRGQRTGFAIFELTGPGPEYPCQNVVDEMRKDGRVLSIHVDEESDDVPAIAAVSASDRVATSDMTMRVVASGALRRTLDLRTPDLRSLRIQSLQHVVTSSDSDEAEAVTVAAARLLIDEEPDRRRSLAGIASLYWAVRHPPEAWRVLLPIQLDGDDSKGENPGRAGNAMAATPAEQREISANAGSTALAHDTAAALL